jgi:hypothetical protein
VGFISEVMIRSEPLSLAAFRCRGRSQTGGAFALSRVKSPSDGVLSHSGKQLKRPSKNKILDVVRNGGPVMLGERMVRRIGEVTCHLTSYGLSSTLLNTAFLSSVFPFDIVARLDWWLWVRALLAMMSRRVGTNPRPVSYALGSCHLRNHNKGPRCGCSIFCGRASGFPSERLDLVRYSDSTIWAPTISGTSEVLVHRSAQSLRGKRSSQQPLGIRLA